MYKVKLSNIQKIKPEFKLSDIDKVHFLQNVGNDNRADLIYLKDESVIQVTWDCLMLFSNEFGYLELDNALLASYPCINTPAANSYSFELIEDTKKADVALPPFIKVEKVLEDDDSEKVLV